MDDLERSKVKVTNGAVTAIGMWGYTPVGLTGLLVFLFVFFFVRRIFVTDISDVGGRTVVKLWRMVDLRVRQVISPFGELWPRGYPPRGQKVKNLW